MTFYSRFLIVSSLLMATSLSASTSRAQKSLVVPDNGPYQPKAVPGNGPYHRPARMQDLSYLTPGLYNTNLNRPQWTEVLLTWLVEERNNPTPTFTGGGGGPIDSSYMQAQIIKTLGDEGSPLLLSQIADSPTLNDEDIRDAVRLALARMGDRRQAPALRRIIIHHQDPWFRALAVEGCQNIGFQQALPELKKALQDPYSESFNSMHEGFITFYPVRRLAQQAIHFLKVPDALDKAQQRSLRFSQTFEIERQTITFSSTAKTKLITALNSRKRTRIARNASKN